ncbi:hypothetical protein LEP1GSC037_2284 [Leptospira interrogans str. 2006001854]|uniref:Uncharacterized protein n=1 Tax=Leptospira interrogans str. 2006001854 TaxID=1001590 RepID=M6GIV2_LEPIR|nr:hypothetical protein LEP1GSC037_2284 [Leptospira interrogans str. 2006001854]
METLKILETEGLIELEKRILLSIQTRNFKEQFLLVKKETVL